MSDIVVAPTEIVTDPILLDGNGDSLTVEGTVDTGDQDPAVLVQGAFTTIDILPPDGTIRADGTAIRVEGVAASIENGGTIDGGFNGIDIANGTLASAIIENEGLITSESRAINIGGFGARVDNRGRIETTDDPRNGTVYGDITATSIVIENAETGVIDVGEGNNGDAISLELGPVVSGSIVNEGLIQGRGEAVGNNQASAVRLYSGPDQPEDLPSVFIGDVVNEDAGTLAAETGPAVIVEENTTLDGDIVNRGLIESANVDNGIGVLFEAGSDLTGTLVNEEGATISGGRDGVTVGNGGDGSFTIENEGLITSTSRAVNLGADDNTLINRGRIETSDDPRNGTVYGDITANNIVIENEEDGVIDVGEGNNGDAISLELGPVVSGSIVNEGLVQGRGEAVGNNQASAVRLYSGPDQPEDLPSVFTGDVVNEDAGTLTAETGPAVIVEENTTLDGDIVNRGLIESDNVDNGIGVLFEAGSDLTGTLLNEEGATISGGRDGVTIGNGGDGSFTIENEGLITSTSRAVNLGADDNTLINRGRIETSDDPRNGTVYGDITANNIVIENEEDGVIDVGEDNNGDAISLELGPVVSGSIVNEGLVQGRGDAVGNNQASAVRLYSGPDQPDDLPSIFTGDVVNEETGTLTAETGPAVIVEEDTTLDGDIVNRGLIESDNVDNGIGVLFEAGSDLTGTLLNEEDATISGGRDGVTVGNGGDGSFTIENDGLITSASRAVNLGADDNTLINRGQIETSDDPRNGTVYGDITANNIVIENEEDGVIDVGEDNNGDAISLELGPVVSGSIVNEGLIQGRGDALGNNQASAVRLYSGPDQPEDLPSVFTGDVVNEDTGTLAAETGPAVIVEENTTLDGDIVNRGLISGGADDDGTTAGGDPGSGLLAIDTREADGSIDVLNTGSILGDVVLSDGNDRYLGARGSVDGIVSGGGGSDTLVGGTEDNVLLGDDGADLLFGRGGDDTLGGGAGQDLLVGGSGDDDLDGGSGVDTLFGGSGSDTLNGGAGLDALVGGADDDTFVYEQGGGSDRILDFQVDDDLLDLTDFDFADAEEVLDLAREVGRSTVIDFGNGDQIVLLGVDLANLSEDAILV